MPELPEVETVVQGLSRDLVGLKISSGKVLCPRTCKDQTHLDTKTIKGKKVISVRRRGKMIIINLEENHTLLFHLGMTGQLIFSSPHGLVDQYTHFIAGIGNIYADEILFRARLHPLLPASLLKREGLKRLWGTMREVLLQAIWHKGSSIRNYVDTDTIPGKFQDFHRVYGKESNPCSACGQKIKRIKVNGRSSYFCPSCQNLDLDRIRSE